MWLIAKTKVNQENRAEKNLINQGFTCFLPKITRRKLLNSHWIDKSEVLFTSYIFIKKDNFCPNLALINNTYGVSRLLTSNDTGLPHFISSAIINDIIGKCKKNIYINSLKDGNKVICQTMGSEIHGIFKEFCGKNRAKVLLTMLNRPMEVLINKDLVHKVL